MTIALTLHILGVITWIGGITVLQFLATKKMLGASTEYPPVALKVIRLLVTPGLILAWVAGLAMLLSNWSVLYSKAGWMHGKLTIALILTALTGIFTGKIRKTVNKKGENKLPVPSIVPWVTLFLTLLVIVLVEFRFGS